MVVSDSVNTEKEAVLKRLLEDLQFRIFKCDANQKKPSEIGWQDKASNDYNEVKSWFLSDYYNYGILCGLDHQGKYLTVIDVDDKNGKQGLETCKSITNHIHTSLLDTFTVRTPSGGLHYYFSTNNAYRNSTNVQTGIDIRGIGGYEGAFIERIDDRRFFILDVLPNLKFNKPYFDPIEKDLGNGRLEELMYMLTNRDISKRNFERIPMTEAKRGTVMNNLDSLDSWIFSLIITGEIDLQKVSKNNLKIVRFLETQSFDLSIRFIT
jgi:hypothetical protein